MKLSESLAILIHKQLLLWWRQWQWFDDSKNVGPQRSFYTFSISSSTIFQFACFPFDFPWFGNNSTIRDVSLTAEFCGLEFVQVYSFIPTWNERSKCSSLACHVFGSIVCIPLQVKRWKQTSGKLFENLLRSKGSSEVSFSITFNTCLLAYLLVITHKKDTQILV